MKILVCLLVVSFFDDKWAKPMENKHQDLALTKQQAPHYRTKRQAESLPKLCDCEAVAYEHPNFAGRSLSIRHQNADFRNNNFDDRVDSIKIYGKCRWLFYTSSDFQGNIHYLPLSNFSSAPSWGGPGNHISSARVLPPAGTNAVALFDGNNYVGRMLILYQSCDDLDKFGFDNQASSMIVLGGSWKVYPDKNYSGAHDTRSSAEIPFIHGHVTDNSMSSVKLV